jgi:nitrite reductase/ring-hydroxylating ferredoxin subunit
MKRREFIKRSCVACLSMPAIPFVLNSCTALLNTTGTLVKDGLILNTKDFTINDKGSSAYRSFLIVRNEALKYPICIYRFSEKQYSALWMRCAHQGAELQASGDYLQCPAHGSEFNNKGLVTNGPASTNLRTFPVTVNNDEIFIDLRKQS